MQPSQMTHNKMQEDDGLKTSNYRRQLLLRLKDIAKSLMPFVHNKETQILNEENQNIAELCSTLELIFFHELKGFGNSVANPAWHMIERLYLLQPPCYALHQTVQAILRIASLLHTPTGKFRGWIRQALGTQLMEECLVFMFSQSTLLSKFYSVDAIFTHTDEQQILVAIVRSLKVLSIRFDIENCTTLNQLPNNLDTSNTKASDPPSSLEITNLDSASRKVVVVENNPPDSQSNQEPSFLRTLEDRLDRIIDNFWLSNNSSSSTATNAQVNGAGNTVRTSGNVTPLFQHSSLKYILYDEYRCTHANLQPQLGIPNQIRKCLSFLSQHCDYTELFRQSVSQPQVAELKKYMEGESSEIPISLFTVPNVSYLLIQWLLQLPEPLLGYVHFEAYIAVSSMDDLSQRKHTYSMLLVDTPWYSKPIVVQLVSFLKKLLSPSFISQNQLNIVALGTLFTPCFLCPKSSKRIEVMSTEEIEQLHWQSIIQCSSIFQEILLHSEEILLPLQQELQEKQVHLMQKCSFIRQLQDGLLQGFPLIVLEYIQPPLCEAAVSQETLEIKASNVKGKRMVAVVFQILDGDKKENDGFKCIHSEGLTQEEDELIRKLWHTLCLVDFKIQQSHGSGRSSLFVEGLGEVSLREAQDEGGVVREVSIPPFPDNLYAHLNTLEIINHPRWLRCGFPMLYHSRNNSTSTVDSNESAAVIGKKGYFLSEFHCYEGSLALNSMIQFIHKYPEKSATMMVEFLRYRTRHCSFSQVVVLIASLVGEILQLLPHHQVSDVSHDRHRHHHPVHNHAAPMQFLAKLPVWGLFNDNTSFQELFDIGVLCFDEIWKNNTERIGELPHDDTYATVMSKTKALLWEIMLHQPTNICQIWEIWMNLRLQEEEQIFQILQPTPIKVNSKDLLSATMAQKGSTHIVHNSSPQEIPITDCSIPMLHASLRRGKVHLMGNDSDDSDGSDDEGFQDTHSVEAVDQIDKKILNNNEVQKKGNEMEMSNESPDRIIINPRSSTLSSANRKSEDTGVSMLNTTDIMLDHYSQLSSSSQIRVDTMAPNSSSMNNSTKSSSQVENANVMNEHHNIRMALAEQTRELQVKTEKRYGGIITHIYGGSKILNNSQVHHLEAVLPSMYQCYQWKLLYRMSLHGANLNTLLSKAKSHLHTLLVIQDSGGAIFGALLTDYLRIAERDKYYGNGTTGVWSFTSGSMKYYPWSYLNNYFIITSQEMLGIGGGGNFAIYLDGELNNGSSGPCKTFNSPTLASAEEFVCIGCELFALEA